MDQETSIFAFAFAARLHSHWMQLASAVAFGVYLVLGHLATRTDASREISGASRLLAFRVYSLALAALESLSFYPGLLKAGLEVFQSPPTPIPHGIATSLITVLAVLASSMHKKLSAPQLRRLVGVVFWVGTIDQVCLATKLYSFILLSSYGVYLAVSLCIIGMVAKRFKRSNTFSRKILSLSFYLSIAFATQLVGWMIHSTVYANPCAFVAQPAALISLLSICLASHLSKHRRESNQPEELQNPNAAPMISPVRVGLVLSIVSAASIPLAQGIEASRCAERFHAWLETSTASLSESGCGEYYPLFAYPGSDALDSERTMLDLPAPACTANPVAHLVITPSEAFVGKVVRLGSLLRPQSLGSSGSILKTSLHGDAAQDCTSLKELLRRWSNESNPLPVLESVGQEPGSGCAGVVLSIAADTPASLFSASVRALRDHGCRRIASVIAYHKDTRANRSVNIAGVREVLHPLDTGLCPFIADERNWWPGYFSSRQDALRIAGAGIMRELSRCWGAVNLEDLQGHLQQNLGLDNIQIRLLKFNLSSENGSSCSGFRADPSSTWEEIALGIARIQPSERTVCPWEQ